MKTIYLVGRFTENKPWQVMGIFDSEERAIDECTNDNDFVGPLNMNEKLPEEVVGWKGAYYPVNDGKVNLLGDLMSIVK